MAGVPRGAFQHKLWLRREGERGAREVVEESAGERASERVSERASERVSERGICDVGGWEEGDRCPGEGGRVWV